MPGSLTEIETRQQQARLIALLSQGMTRRAACKALDIGYSTATLWHKDENFSAALAREVERRQSLIEQTLRDAADELIKSDAEILGDELRRYHAVIVDSQATRLSIAKEMITKGYRRILDLPDESLSASDAIRLLTAGDALAESAISAWGQALAVDELQKKLGGYQ